MKDARGRPRAIPPQLAKVILDHIAETTRELRGKLRGLGRHQRDLHQSRLHGHPGPPCHGGLVQGGARRRSGAKLYINDFNIIEGDDKAHQDDYAATIKYLIDEGAPIDGIGLQSHFPSRVTPHGRPDQSGWSASRRSARSSRSPSSTSTRPTKARRPTTRATS